MFITDNKLILLFLIICNSLMFNQVIGIDNDKILEKCKGKSHKSCSECMLAHADCVWLKDKDIGDLDRCTSKYNANHNNVIRGRTSGQKLVQNDDFRLPSNKDEPAIQIKPQKLKLYMRHNEKLTFQVKYKAMPDYPLDIYYLLDQTYSMGKHREYLIKLGDTLANTLEELTKNYQIAFGYFSDKVSMPYYAMAEKILANPCMVVDGVDECAPGSNFVHSLNFTKETSLFIDEVKKFEHTANMDDLEGGLDALMQIIMCDREFGWRKHSRKMIVMATDGYIHTAGDGLLGGITKKMDYDKCAMEFKNDKWVYDGLQYDYPSIEEIYRKLRENKMVLLLGIQEKDQQKKMWEYYKAMNDLLYEVSYLDMLKTDPKNVIDTVRDGYKDVVQKVQLQIKDAPPYLQFDAEVYCLPGHRNVSMSCWNVTLDKEYVFNFTVELKEIPRYRRIDKFTIEEMHIHEQLEIEVEYPEYCDCPKEFAGNMNGTYECGFLKCHPGWVGDKCDKKCNREMGRYENDTYTSLTCSNYGDFDETSCKCICDQNRIGDYCEFPQCPANTANAICSGHGDCDEGVCICHENYSGDICDCTTDTETCQAPGRVEECSSNGKCICGECKCKLSEGGLKYFGRYCEHCTGCHSCKYNDVLVRHVLGRLDDTEIDFYTFVERSHTFHEFECKMELSKNVTTTCELSYKFDINDTIAITYHQECTLQTFNYTAGGGIVLGVLLALFVPLIIWKIMVTQKDKREYAKFKSNVKSGTSFEQNDLYVSPVTHYFNPNLDGNKQPNEAKTDL